MGIMCYLCRRKASKRDRISLHKFPKDPAVRNKWIEACNLSISDNLTYIYICSLHFAAKDIDRGLEFQSRCILKSGAVPSIGVPNPVCSNKDNINIMNSRNSNVTEVEMINVHEDANELDMIVNMNTFDNADADPLTIDNGIATSLLEGTHIQELQLPTNASDEVSFERGNDFIKRHRLDSTDARKYRTVDSPVNRNGKSEDSCYSIPKRRVFEPRYTSEIRIPDFDTPKRTRRILYFVRDSDEKKTKLIKSLRNRNRKLEIRISELEKIIEDLKKKDTLAQETGDPLLNIANRSSNYFATKMH